MAFVSDTVARAASALLVAWLCAGCADMLGDLVPSGEDRRVDAGPDAPGPQVGSPAPDFRLAASIGDPVTLSELLPKTKGVVMYFTTWCPVCDANMRILQDEIYPQNQGVAFLIIDLVSGPRWDVETSQVTFGYATSPMTFLADTMHKVMYLYDAIMGTTVVIDPAGIIRMNEEFKAGTKLRATLAALPN